MITLAEAVLKMSADPSGLNAGLDAAEKKVGSFGQSVRHVMEVATGVSLSNVTERLLAIPRQLTSMALGAIASYESLSLSLETLAAKEMRAADSTLTVETAMLKAKDAAKETINWVEQLAVKSPFTTQGVAQALKMAQAYGFTTEEAKRMTQALIDFAAGSGAGEYAMQRIAMVMGQIKGAGRLLGQDMMQLTSTGLPVLQILADHFGKTTAEVVKMREQGILPAQEAIEAITKYLETSFAGAAARQASSWAGLLSTIQDLKDIAIRDFFTPMFTTVQPYVQKFVDTLGSDALRAKLQEIGTLLADKIGGAIQALEPIVQQVVSFVQEHGTQIVAILRDLLTVMLAVKAAQVFGGLIQSAAQFVQQIALMRSAWVTMQAAFTAGQIAAGIGALVNPVMLAVTAIGLLVGGFILLKQHQEASIQASYNQSAQIALSSASYNDYKRQMDEAGVKTDLLTREVYELIQAHKDQANAAKLGEYTRKIDEWSSAVDQLNRLQEQAASRVADFGVGVEELTRQTVLLNRAEIDLQYEGLLRTDSMFLEMAASAGLLTDAMLAVLERETAEAEAADRAALVHENLTTALQATTAAANEQVAEIANLAAAWETAATVGEKAVTEYADKNQAAVMERLQSYQEAYADHAVNIAKLEFDKQNALTALQDEYENLRANLVKKHDQAGLAQLNAALKAKQSGIVTYYNNRIKVEQSGQQTTYDIAKRYYVAILKVLMTQLREQLKAQVANMAALSKATIGGYAAMGAAVAAYNKIVEGQEAIDATKAAIQEVMNAFDAIEQAGQEAAAAAIADMNSWESASGSLSDSLDDVSDSMDNVGEHAGSAGSNVSTQFKDPVEEAAKAVERIGQMVEKAIEAFDLLGDYRGPRAGWQEKLTELLANVTEMIQAVYAAAEALKDAGFYAIEDEKTGAGPLSRLLAFVSAMSNIAAMITKALDLLSALDAVDLPDGNAITALLDELIWLLGSISQKVMALDTAVDDDTLADATDFAKDMIALLDMLTKGLNALVALGQVDLVNGDMVAALLDEITWLLRTLVVDVNTWAADVADLTSSAADFADAITPTVDLLFSGLTALRALGDVRLVNGAVVLAVVEEVSWLLAVLTAKVADWTTYVTETMQEAAADFATTVAPVVELLTKGIAALDTLADVQFHDAAVILAQLEHVGWFLATMIANIGTWSALLGADVQTAAAQFAAAAAPVVSLLSAAMKTLTELADFELLPGAQITDSLDQISWFLALLVDKVGQWAAQLSDTLQGDAKQFADNATPVVNLVKTALGVLTELADLGDIAWANLPATLTQVATAIGNIVTAIAQAAAALSTEEQTAARQLAENATPVVNLVKNAVSALIELNDMPAPSAAGILRLRSFLTALMTQIAWAGLNLATEIQEAARQFAENAGPVVNMVRTAVEALKALDTDLTVPTAAFAKLRGYLVALVQQIAWAGVNMAPELQEAAHTFAENMGPVVDLMANTLDLLIDLQTAITDGVLSLSNTGINQPGTLLAGALSQLRQFILQVVTAITELLDNPDLADLDTTATGFAAWFTTAAGPFSTALDLLTKLQQAVAEGSITIGSDLGINPPVSLAGALSRLRQFILEVAAAINELAGNPDLATLDEDATTFATWFNASVGPFSTALDLLSKLQQAVAAGVITNNAIGGIGINPPTRSWSQALSALRQFILEVTAAINALMADPDLAHLAVTAADFATWFTASIGPFSSALDLLTKLQQAVADKVLNNGQNVGGMGINPPVRSWASALSQLRQFILEAVQAINDLMDNPLVATLAEQADEFATQLGTIMDGLGRSITVLAALGTYTSVTDLEARVTAFLADWEIVLQRLAQVSTATQALADENMRKFAVAVGEIGSGLQSAIGFLTDIRAWRRSQDLYDLIDDLVDALDYTLDQLRTAVTDWDEEGLTLVQVFGQACASVMTGLKAALELALELPEEWAEPPTDAWEAFFTWASGIFDDFVAAVTAWAAEQEDPAATAGVINQMAQAMGTLMQALQAALTLALAFPEDWAEPDPEQFADFFLWAAGVFGLFIQGVQNWAAQQADPADTMGLVGATGQAMGAVFQGLTAALDFFNDLQTYVNANTVPRINAFLDQVETVFGTIVTWAQTGAGADIDLEIANAFGAAMQSVFGALQTALSLFVALNEGAGSLAGVFDQRMALLLQRISETLTAFATYVSGPLGSAAWLLVADDFSAAVGGVFDVLSAALAVFGQLDEQGLPDLADLQDLIDAILLVFANFTSGLVGAGDDVGDAVGGIGGTVWSLPNVLPDAETLAGWGAGVAEELGAALAAYDLTGDATALGTALYNALYGSVGYGGSIYTQYMGAWGWNSSAVLAYALAAYMGDDTAAAVLGGGEDNFYDALNALFGNGSGFITAMKSLGGGSAWALIDGLTNLLTYANMPPNLQGILNSGVWALATYLETYLNTTLNITNNAGPDIANNLVAGLAWGIDPAHSGQIPALQTAINALIAWITNYVQGALQIASPSKVFTRIGQFIPAGLAQGIENGIPTVSAALGQLAAVVDPLASGMFGMDTAVTSERRIVVEFRGEAGGGAPLDPQQFNALKRELAYAIRLGA